MENIKLVDFFVYQDNFELLKFRINRLYKHVYKFVISGVTENNLNDIESIGDPLNKIEVIQIDESQVEDIDTLNQNSIFQILHLFDDDAIFYLSYLNEILMPEYISWVGGVAIQNFSNILKIPLQLYDSNEEELNDLPYVATKMHLARYSPSDIRKYISMSNSNFEFSPIYITCDGYQKKFGIKYIENNPIEKICD